MARHRSIDNGNANRKCLSIGSHKVFVSLIAESRTSPPNSSTAAVSPVHSH